MPAAGHGPAPRREASINACTHAPAPAPPGDIAWADTAVRVRLVFLRRAADEADRGAGYLPDGCDLAASLANRSVCAGPVAPAGRGGVLRLAQRSRRQMRPRRRRFAA